MNPLYSPVLLATTVWVEATTRSSVILGLRGSCGRLLEIHYSENDRNPVIAGLVMSIIDRSVPPRAGDRGLLQLLIGFLAQAGEVLNAPTSAGSRYHSGPHLRSSCIASPVQRIGANLTTARMFIHSMLARDPLTYHTRATGPI